MEQTIHIELFEVLTPSIAEQIVAISHRIPEFNEPYKREEYYARLEGVSCCLLFAKIDEHLAGFKLGYGKSSRVFYSWMGGVLPAYRKIGVAKTLAQHQEQWAVEKEYEFIQMKTRNYLKNMLHFALSNQFYITGIEAYPNPLDNRILLEKALKG
ncbi:MAG: GNAT family N-acetyltransferase [Flammeovirgaceae bacterium]